MKRTALLSAAALLLPACGGCPEIPVRDAGGAQLDDAKYQKALEKDDVKTVARGSRATVSREDFIKAVEAGEESQSDKCPGYFVVRYWAKNEMLDAKTLDREGRRPLLHHAFDPIVARALIDAGADPNAIWKEDSDRTPPLQSIIYMMPEMMWDADDEDRFREDALETVRVLVEAGANPNMQNVHGRSAVDLAEQYGNHLPFNEEVVEILKSAGGFDKKDRFVEVDIFLWAAIEGRDLDAAKQAIKNGASVNDGLPGDWSMKPLRVAVMSGQEDMVKLLLDSGAEPDELYTDENGKRTSILTEWSEKFGLSFGGREMAKLLREGGAHDAKQLLEWEAQKDARAQEAKERRQRMAERDAKLREAAVAAKEALRRENERLDQEVSREFEERNAPTRTDRMNVYIDAFNKGAGNKRYKRYDKNGNYTWHEVQE